MKSWICEVLFACKKSMAEPQPFHSSKFLVPCPWKVKDGNARKPLTELVAFDVVSEEAWLQVVFWSLEAHQSHLYRFFLVSFLGFLLICGAVAFGFFTVSEFLGSKLSESYKNQLRNSQ